MHVRYILQPTDINRLLALIAQFQAETNQLDDADYFDEFARELVAPDDEERQLYAIPRVGRYLGRERRSVEGGPTDANGDEGSRLPRLGVRDEFPLAKYMFERQASLPRVGQLLMSRSLNDIDDAKDEYSRALLPRFGLRSLEDKRAMGMLRMGKRADQMRMIRGMNMLRMGKRGSMSMLRMGRSAMDGADEAATSKRAGMSMLRMGKRDSEVTDSDSVGNDTPPAEKKNMGMLRMGKRSD